MAHLSSKSKSKMYETVANIAFEAGKHTYYSGNSRADMQHFIYLAEKFHKEYDKEINADWEDVGKDYMDEIESFITRELKLTEKLILNYTHAFDGTWDDLEVGKCREKDGSTIRLDEDDDTEPGDFWSVYAHQTDGGAMCIADFPTEKAANDFAETLRKAVRSFKDNSYLALYNHEDILNKIIIRITELKARTWNDSYSAALDEVKTFVQHLIR